MKGLEGRLIKGKRIIIISKENFKIKSTNLYLLGFLTKLKSAKSSTNQSIGTFSILRVNNGKF